VFARRRHDAIEKISEVAKVLHGTVLARAIDPTGQLCHRGWPRSVTTATRK